MIKTILAITIIIHGLIHSLGFWKAFQLAEIKPLTQEIPKPIGLLWIISTLSFIAVAAILILNKDWWWMLAVPALGLSQWLIIKNWPKTKYGTIANVIILVGLVVGYGAWSFNTMARKEVKAFIAPITSLKKEVTKEMLGSLPLVVQKWVKHSNIIGKEIIYCVYLKQKGKLRTTPNGKWLPAEAEQWFKTEKPGFIWIAKVKLAPGIYLAGRDKYENGKGQMLIKLLSLIPLVRAEGKEVDQGAMVRYLAEIIWFPSAALNDYIKWEEIDSLSAKATMTYQGIVASGGFKFDDKGDVVSFEAKRYYDRKSAATLEDWLIQIEPNNYKEFQGIRIPTRATVTWKLKEGDFTWYKLEIADVHYN